MAATRNGFATVTFNRGFVQSVNGRQLTIREGTKAATYKTVTPTIPSSAKVRDNGESASLSQLTQGQRVGVVQGPKRPWWSRGPRSPDGPSAPPAPSGGGAPSAKAPVRSH